MKVRTIKSNQTEVDIADDTILVSYSTPVAAISAGSSYRTDKKWSMTTSKHIREFFRRHDFDPEKAKEKPQEWFDEPY